MESAEALRKAWKEKVKADPTLTCDHPNRRKEKYMGQDTGDRVCIVCGDAIYRL